MKILVVSGFLGAGKTTFITEMARRSRRKFVVMENEMGAVGVDGGLLSSSLGEDVEVWELTQGCICCSMKTDFASSVLTIENALQPEFLLVEPTGVGMLSRIMENLNRIAYERIELLSPVTVLDGLNFRQHAREFPEILADQIAAAGTVVVSKVENSAFAHTSSIEELVRSHAPTAELVLQPYRRQPDDWWDSLWRKAPDGSLRKEEAEAAELDLSVLNLEQPRISSPPAMVFLLENAVHGTFGRVVRAKGTVRTGNDRLRFDVAGGRYSITGAPFEEDETKAVVIGRQLDARALYEALDANAPGRQGFTLSPFPP